MGNCASASSVWPSTDSVFSSSSSSWKFKFRGVTFAPEDHATKPKKLWILISMSPNEREKERESIRNWISMKLTWHNWRLSDLTAFSLIKWLKSSENERKNLHFHFQRDFYAQSEKFLWEPTVIKFTTNAKKAEKYRIDQNLFRIKNFLFFNGFWCRWKNIVLTLFAIRST